MKFLKFFCVIIFILVSINFQSIVKADDDYYDNDIKTDSDDQPQKTTIGDNVQDGFTTSTDDDDDDDDDEAKITNKIHAVSTDPIQQQYTTAILSNKNDDYKTEIASATFTQTLPKASEINDVQNKDDNDDYSDDATTPVVQGQQQEETTKINNAENEPKTTKIIEDLPEAPIMGYKNDNHDATTAVVQDHTTAVKSQDSEDDYGMDVVKIVTTPEISKTENVPTTAINDDSQNRGAVVVDFNDLAKSTTVAISQPKATEAVQDEHIVKTTTGADLLVGAIKGIYMKTEKIAVVVTEEHQHTTVLNSHDENINSDNIDLKTIAIETTTHQIDNKQEATTAVDLIVGAIKGSNDKKDEVAVVATTPAVPHVTAHLQDPEAQIENESNNNNNDGDYDYPANGNEAKTTKFEEPVQPETTEVLNKGAIKSEDENTNNSNNPSNNKKIDDYHVDIATTGRTIIGYNGNDENPITTGSMNNDLAGRIVNIMKETESPIKTTTEAIDEPKIEITKPLVNNLKNKTDDEKKDDVKVPLQNKVAVSTQLSTRIIVIIVLTVVCAVFVIIIVVLVVIVVVRRKRKVPVNQRQYTVVSQNDRN